jgi:hypothetical protein
MLAVRQPDMIAMLKKARVLPTNNIANRDRIILEHLPLVKGERRSEPRFEAQEPVILTLLSESGIKLSALAIEMSGNGMRLLLHRAITVGATVKLEGHDSMILGEVCYCQPHAKGFFVGLKLQHVLSNMNELAKLNRRLLDRHDIAPVFVEARRIGVPEPV